MSDLVSRQNAIDEIDKYIDKFDCIDENFLNGLKTTKKILNNLPSSQSERPKGNWIAERSCNGIKKGDVLKIDKYGYGAFDASCSVCGKWLVASDEYACYANFCPYCGADMRGNENEITKNK